MLCLQFHQQNFDAPSTCLLDANVFKSGDQKPNINSNTFKQKAWTPTHGKVEERLE